MQCNNTTAILIFSFDFEKLFYFSQFKAISIKPRKAVYFLSWLIYFNDLLYKCIYTFKKSKICWAYSIQTLYKTCRLTVHVVAVANSGMHINETFQ